MSLTRVDVTKRQDGRWQVMKQHAEKASFICETKAEAVKKAATLQDVTVRIHKADGKIQEERTYPRKRDPKGSRG